MSATKQSTEIVTTKEVTVEKTVKVTVRQMVVIERKERTGFMLKRKQKRLLKLLKRLKIPALRAKLKKGARRARREDLLMMWLME